MYTGTHLWVTSVQCNQVNNLLTYSVYFRITTSVSILQSHTLRMTTASAIMFKMPDISILQCPRHHHQSVNNPLTISIPPTQGSAAASDMDLDQLLQTWIPSPTGRPSSNQDLPGEDLPTQQGDTPLNRETQQGDSPQVQPTHPPIGDGGLRSSLTKVSHRVLTSLPSRYNIRMTSSPSEDLPTSDKHHRRIPSSLFSAIIIISIRENLQVIYIYGGKHQDMYANIHKNSRSSLFHPGETL